VATLSNASPAASSVRAAQPARSNRNPHEVQPTSARRTRSARRPARGRTHFDGRTARVRQDVIHVNQRLAPRPRKRLAAVTPITSEPTRPGLRVTRWRRCRRARTRLVEVPRITPSSRSICARDAISAPRPVLAVQLDLRRNDVAPHMGAVHHDGGGRLVARSLDAQNRCHAVDSSRRGAPSPARAVLTLSSPRPCRSAAATCRVSRRRLAFGRIGRFPVLSPEGALHQTGDHRAVIADTSAPDPANPWNHNTRR